MLFAGNVWRALSQTLIRLDGVQIWLEDGTFILRDIAWHVQEGEHWVVLGPNGAGKSTLFAVATARRYPSRGVVEVIGRRFGEADMLVLRSMINVVDPHQAMYEWFTVEDVILTGATGTVQPQPDLYTGENHRMAADLIAHLGLSGMGDREIRTLSQGERQRVRIARAMMSRPRLLVLDEPALGLDLPARESLIAVLDTLCKDDRQLATIMISHHLEELPGSSTHALLLADGRIVARGPIDDVLTSEKVSSTYGIAIEVERTNGRWSARGEPSWSHGE
jgi:iron complex transport system ATP-binding protein